MISETKLSWFAMTKMNKHFKNSPITAATNTKHQTSIRVITRNSTVRCWNAISNVQTGMIKDPQVQIWNGNSLNRGGPPTSAYSHRYAKSEFVETLDGNNRGDPPPPGLGATGPWGIIYIKNKAVANAMGLVNTGGNGFIPGRPPTLAWSHGCVQIILL